MGYKRDFTTTIERQTTGVSKAGFGTILILSAEGAKEAKTYMSMESVAMDFETGTDTYVMANDLFAQDVDKVLIVGTEGADVTGSLNKVANEGKEFFGVVSTNKETVAIEAIADWTETQRKIYAATSTDKSISSNYENTLLAYHQDDNLAEKCLAYMLVRDIGSVDLDGKVIPTVTESDVTEDEYNDLKENHVNIALEKYGNITIDGGDVSSGEKLDIMLSEYWLRARIEEAVAFLKANTPKIDYTNAGVSLIIGAVNPVLAKAVRNGIIATDEDGLAEYKISYLPVDQVPATERVDRVYDYVEWEARLAGSIREGNINGILTV